MILTEDNIQEWKAELDKRMLGYSIDNFSQCLSDQDWLEEYQGRDVQDAIDDEIENWD